MAEKRDLNKPSNFYICSPFKNVKCDGRFRERCGVQCFCTTNPIYAMDPTHMLTFAEYYQEEGKRKRYQKSIIRR